MVNPVIFYYVSIVFLCVTAGVFVAFPPAYLGPVHIAPKEFENGGFTLKTHQMFFVNTRKRIIYFPLLF